jgi:HD-like signal output (HDOD) protein/ActR/RegA family two-component response regulator
MKRILFVDDDINVLSGLRRGLHSMRAEWQMDFVDNAANAMDILETVRVDALVTDVRMRQMDGFQLLKETRNAYPQIVRIVLSGETQQDALARSLASMHLFLSKPCDTELLKHRVRDVLARGDEIRDETLKSLVAQLAGVPSLTLMFFEIMKLFDAEKPDVEKIAQVVSMDMGMAAAVLHYVNSGYFPPNNVTSNPERAVRWLGLQTVRDLIVRNRLCCSFDTNGFEYFDVMSLWSNSISMATSARAIAVSHSNDGVLADDAFAAGMFHDLGQVVLASVLGDFYDSVVERSMSRGEPVWETERDMIGSTHAEVGAYLLGLWGMPDAVVNAVAHHHSSSYSGEDFSATTAVRLADSYRQQNLCKTRS